MRAFVPSFIGVAPRHMFALGWHFHALEFEGEWLHGREAGTGAGVGTGVAWGE